MKILKPKQIIVALDFDSIKEASSIVKNLDPEIYRLLDEKSKNESKNELSKIYGGSYGSGTS